MKQGEKKMEKGGEREETGMKNSPGKVSKCSGSIPRGLISTISSRFAI